MVLPRTNAMFSTSCKESDIQHPLALLLIGKQMYVFSSSSSLFHVLLSIKKTNETNTRAVSVKQGKVVQMGIREIVIAGTVIVIHELDDVYDSVTGRPLTGSWVWDSALVLSKWMFTQVDFQGKSVLEVGAGAGLPGLVAARLGASRVVLTDVKPLLPGLLKNVEANSLTDRVEVKELIWGSDELALRLSEMVKFDIVLMSDVFFDTEEMEGLGRTLKMVCEDRTNIWAASELRPWTGECLNQLTTLGFEVVELPSEPSEPVKGEDSNPFAIFHIALPAEEKCNAGPEKLWLLTM